MSAITLRDIAEVVGVSQNTVSLVLRDKKGIKESTRQEVLRVAQELGYVQKRAQPASAGNIGVLLALGNASNVYFHSEVLEEFEVCARDCGYAIVLINVTNTSTPDSIKAMIQSNGVAGVVILGDIDEWVVDAVVDTKLPFIATGFFSLKHTYDCVLEDNVAGTLMVMQHLEALGYRHVGFIGDIHFMSSAYERYSIYQTFLSTKGYWTPEDAQFVWIHDSYADITNHTFLEKKLRACTGLPEAFFCSNDKVAAVLLKALHACGLRVPDDIGVIGFDNNEMAKLSAPTITSVDTFYDLQAQRTAREIIRKIEMKENKSTVGRILTKVQLVEGGSLRKL